MNRVAPQASGKVACPSPVQRHAVLLAAVLVAALGATACSGEDGTVEAPTPVDADNTNDVQIGTDDTSVPVDTTADDADAATPDTTEPDGGDDVVAPTCPGDPGCACTSTSQCNSGYCIESPKGQVCAATCTDSCPEDFKCVTGDGADAVNICVPKHGKACNPCSQNTDCTGIGNKDAKCVDFGDAGAFCGTACSADLDCGSGYECKTVQDVTGAETKQCVVQGGAACTCSESAIQQQLSTKCHVVAGDSKCEGKRACLPAGAPGAPEGGGLTACQAPEASTETCDGGDNDCDGETDESTCDDGNACTEDKCGGASGCSNPNAQGPCDADGSVCTEGDTCVDGKCAPGKAIVCDDGNPCTKDVCDPAAGCKYENDDGAACNADDNECTQNDSCKAGKCEAGGAKACASDDGCLLGKCIVETGKCAYSFQEGNPCNDGNPCTQAEVCVTDTCKGDAVKCDDANACTADSCDPKSGCVHNAVSGACDDKDACTDSDTCVDGGCKGLPIDASSTCDDSNPCTTDVCEKDKGCVHKAASGPTCDDGNPCTEGDACKDGTCESLKNTCGCAEDADCAAKEDGNLCNGTLFCDKAELPYTCKVKASTVIACDDSVNTACQTNVCDPATGKCGLDKKPDGLSCNADDSLCTVKDACKDGKCAPGQVQVCDDKNACTDDSCDAKEGCKYTPNAAPCDADDNPCTENDACTLGTCVAGKTKACASDDACVLGKCSLIDGKCKYTFQEGQPCNDGSPCTLGDACKVDKCTGAAANCDDKNPCTGDSCDPQAGCVHVNVAGSCDDGDACTEGDACADGACKGAAFDPAKKCNDGTPCTADSCDPAVGCVQKPQAGQCDDGNPCTVGDACDAGKCAAGTNTCGCQADKDCDAKEDGNLCNGTLFCDKSQPPYQCAVNPATVVKCDESVNGQCQTNVCDPADGKCKLNKQPDNLSCDADGNLCTLGDACQDGKCVVGQVQVCNDGNACTDDSCDPKSGCKYVPNTAPCDADSNACTENDACSSGTCVPGKLKVCDDKEGCTQDVCEQKTATCKYVPLTKTCSDDNQCTTSDACGTDPNTGNYTCVGGKPPVCNDGNVCTVDSCDAAKGCLNAIDASITVPCYTGDPATKNKGQCKEGVQQCTLAGQLGACKGEVLPVSGKEACDGIDNNCDGITDEGCAPTAFRVRFATALVKGKGGKYEARVLTGGSVANGEAKAGSGGTYSAALGFYRWLQQVIGGK